MLDSSSQTLKAPVISTLFSLILWKRKWELPGKVVRRRKGLILHPIHFNPQLPLDIVLWGLPENKPTSPLRPVHSTRPGPPGPSSGQPGWAMNSTQPFSFPNIKCLLSIRSVWGNGNYRIGECPWVKKYLECRNLAGPLIRAGIIPAII